MSRSASCQSDLGYRTVPQYTRTCLIHELVCRQFLISVVAFETNLFFLSSKCRGFQSRCFSGWIRWVCYDVVWCEGIGWKQMQSGYCVTEYIVFVYKCWTAEKTKSSNKNIWCIFRSHCGEWFWTTNLDSSNMVKEMKDICKNRGFCLMNHVSNMLPSLFFYLAPIILLFIPKSHQNI